MVNGGYSEGGNYYFYITEHLGNNRIVANASGIPIQKSHYYPFCTAFAENTPEEQGKQLYQMHQLNRYDFRLGIMRVLQGGLLV